MIVVTWNQVFLWIGIVAFGVLLIKLLINYMKMRSYTEKLFERWLEERLQLWGYRIAIRRYPNKAGGCIMLEYHILRKDDIAWFEKIPPKSPPSPCYLERK